MSTLGMYLASQQTFNTDLVKNMKLITLTFALMLSLLPGIAKSEWLVQNYSNTNNLTNDVITIVFTDLGEHDYVKLNWDLYLMDTWDGYDTNYSWSTDYWGFSVDGVAQEWAFHQNPTASADTNPDKTSEQYRAGDSFFDNAPVTSYKGWFRYYNDFNDGWVFEHDSDTLTLTFYAHGLQSPEDESWAIDRLYVATSDDEVHLDGLGNLQDVNTPFQPAILFMFALCPLVNMFKRKSRK